MSRWTRSFTLLHSTTCLSWSEAESDLNSEDALLSSLAEAVAESILTVDLWTFQRNAGARRFYERNGFVAMEFTDGASNEEREPDVRYRRSIRASAAGG